MSAVWHRIAGAGPAAVVLVAATVASLALPLLRALVPRNRRREGGPARLLLGGSVVLALAAMGLGTMGASSPGNLLQLVGLLALLLGLVCIAGLLAFDVVLPRLRVDVPAIVRDLVLLAIGLTIGVGFLRLAGLDVFSLVTTSAVLTAVVGIALQSTIANVFSGLALQLDRTLRHGEWIAVEHHVGKILEIGWRSTCILTKAGDAVLVPNGELVSKSVVAFGRPARTHRMALRIGFHYRHPPNEVRRVLLEAIRDVPGVADDPAPACGPVDFGDSAVVYALRYWIRDFAHDATIDEEVRTRVWYAARRADLEIPFPIRTLVSDDGNPGARRTAKAADDEERALRRLESSAPFDGLEAEARRRCARGARRVEYARGEHVAGSGAPHGAVHVVDAGEVAVHRRSDGAAPTTLTAGDVLPLHLLSPDDRCTARSDVALYRLDERALEEVLAADPALRARLVELAEARLAAPAPAHGPASPASDRHDRRPAGFAPRVRRLFHPR